MSKNSTIGRVRYNSAVPAGGSPQPAKKKLRLLTVEELMNYAARSLGVRAQTTAELREKLKRRASQSRDIDEVIRRLKEIGFLNDQRFAESYAGWRRENDGLGKTRVVRDLMARRVAPNLAKEAAEKIYSGADECAMIEAFLTRKYRGKNLGALLSNDNPDREKHLASAYRKLRAAGFSVGNSIKVLKRYAAEAERLEEMEDV